MLYTNGQYRVGGEGYLTAAAQPSALVLPTALADPSPRTGVTSLLGFCDLPSRQKAESLQPVETIGMMRVAAHNVGQRTYQLGVSRVLVADGTWLAYAVRNHQDPDAPGTVRGLQLITYEYGTTSEYGAAVGWAEQALDGLINSLRLSYQEGQPVTANLDIWPAVILEGVTPQVSVGVPGFAPLHWVNCTWMIDGVDYKPILAGTDITITNNLIRHGMRNQLGALGSELAISRTAYAITPGPENLQVRHRFRDDLPAALRGTADWGTLTLRAEQPGTGAGRPFFQVAIDHNYLDVRGGDAANARTPQMWSTTNLAYAIELTAGLTG